MTGLETILIFIIVILIMVIKGQRQTIEDQNTKMTKGARSELIKWLNRQASRICGVTVYGDSLDPHTLTWKMRKAAEELGKEDAETLED
jgi:hypothetical protein